MSPNQSHRKQSRKEQKARTRILVKEATRKCFLERGFGQTAIADIAREANVAHGTFYVHFKSKEAVLDELLEEFNRELASRLFALLSPPASPELEAVVEGVAEVFLDHWMENRSFVECCAQRIATGLGIDTLRDGVNPPMADLLRGALRVASPELAMERSRLELVTHGLLAMWLRVGMQYLFGEGIGRRDAQEMLVRMTLGAVKAVLIDEGAENA